MPQILTLDFAVGDIKPVVFNGVVANTGAEISSATYTLTNHETGDIISSDQPTTVSGSTIYTGNITWDTAGQFLVLLAINFADGTLDNKIGCYVSVDPVAT